MDISRASTVTVGRDGPIVYDQPVPIDRENYNLVPDEAAPEQVPDYMLEDASADAGNHSKRLIIAVDFGTTYSAVSYVALEEGESGEYMDLRRIKSIQNFPDDWNFGDSTNRMKSEVPSEVIYPVDPGFRKNENSIDADDEAEHEQGQEQMEDTRTNPPREYLAAQAAGLIGCHGGGGLEIFGELGGEEADRMSIDEESNSFRWGYGVHEAWGLHATHSDPKHRALSRFKLLLDSSETTESIRNELGETLDELKRRGVVENRLHVIVDFLTCLLRHTQSELLNAGFGEGYRKEIVLCVPAIWSQKACRDMQTALAKAMERARFSGVDIQNNSIENLFIVSEPEAAAAFVLAQDEEKAVSAGDTFVLLDAGGGTVDANTYTVSKTTPLRLVREVVEPGGGLYGSSYLNEGFRMFLSELLAGEVYLEEGGNSIKGYIESTMINYFEYRVKRSFDCYTAKGCKQLNVPGLRDNPEKMFQKGCIYIPVSKIKAIFLTRLEGIACLMEEQISLAHAAGARVEKVVLIGGFAASISLKKFLDQRLEQYCKRNKCHIKLIRPDNCATAVASGAVLRAFNKEQGPRRHTRSSYGILRTEPYGDFPEHEGVKPGYDRHDGQPYVFNTIDWVLKLGQEVEPVWICSPFLCSHMFDFWPPVRLICREVLYVSDRATASHYKISHEKNEGAEEVGEIVVDFTFLRDQGLIEPVDGRFNKNGKKVGRKHYQVNYTMVIRVVDRDLQCFAIYDGVLRQKCRLNIASAFAAGVK